MGRPVERPAIVALGSEGTVVAYVIWNEDTETAGWRFYGKSDSGSEKKTVLLGEVGRKSFETRFDVRDSAVYRLDGTSRFFAEAVDGHGKVLVVTQAVLAIKEIIPYDGVAHVAQDFRVQL